MCDLQRWGEEAGFPTLFDYKALFGRDLGSQGHGKEVPWGLRQKREVGGHTLCLKPCPPWGFSLDLSLSHRSGPLRARAPCACSSQPSFWGMALSTAKRGQDASGDGARCSRLQRADRTDLKGKLPTPPPAAPCSRLGRVITCHTHPRLSLPVARPCSAPGTPTVIGKDSWVFSLVSGWPGVSQDRGPHLTVFTPAFLLLKKHKYSNKRQGSVPGNAHRHMTARKANWSISGDSV